MIGYKKIEGWYGLNSYPAIATLLIYDDARKCNPKGGSKWRCDRAKVLKIESYYGSIEYRYGRSYFAPQMGIVGVMYYVDHDVRPNNGFDDDENIECGKGIHYFLSKYDAINY